jgi:hypothetical protein
MFFELLRARRFAPLFWCQFFSAFNDNFVRNMLAMLLLFRFGAGQTGALVTLAIGVFMLPSILLSGPGGEIGDANDKAAVIRRLKAGEILVQTVAAAGLWLDSLPLLYLALFGLGVISALFGPLKYGILPDHLRRSELVAGNALVEGATFLAILLGLVAGALSARSTAAPSFVVLQLMVIALACFAASCLIPPTKVAAPDLAINPNVLASTGALLTALHRDAFLWRAGLALSWFWLTGAIALSLVPVVVRNATHGGIEVEAAISALFAIGISVGSLAAARLAQGNIRLVRVPIAALGMAFFLIEMGLATHGLINASNTAPHREIGLAAFFASSTGLRIAFDVAGLAMAGGFYVVPLFAAVQAEAAPERRARVVAAVNTLNAIFMVAGTLATAFLQSRWIGLSEPALLIILGITNIGAGAYVWRKIGIVRETVLDPTS